MLGWLKRQRQKSLDNRLLRRTAALQQIKARYQIFRALLAANNLAVDHLTDLPLQLRLQGLSAQLADSVRDLMTDVDEMVDKLESLSGGTYRGLYTARHTIRTAIEKLLQRAVRQQEGLACCPPLNDMPSAALPFIGGKAARLAELGSDSRFRIPAGFVVTTKGCRAFLDHKGLFLQIAHLLAGVAKRNGQTIDAATAERIRETICQAPLPADLEEALKKAAAPLLGRGGLAIRSSAISEDGGQHSYAGQFSSILNIRDEAGLLSSFRHVVASNFNHRSLVYRQNAGLDPVTFEMAVLCLEMVEAVAAGILLSRSPARPAGEELLISAVYGLGEAAVGGSAATDLYLVDRQGVVDWQGSQLAEKEKRLVCLPAGGTAWQEVPEEERLQPVLNEEQIRVLAGWGTTLEEQQNTPQDIEWAIDRTGRPLLLQVRPLTGLSPTPETIPHRTPVLAHGSTAAAGVVSGRVRLIRGRRDFDNLPAHPLVLVMPQSFVEAAALLDRINGVVVELGSPADHLSCVARENSIPMITAVHAAGKSLEEGQWVTLDAGRGEIYAVTEEERRIAEENFQHRRSPAKPQPLSGKAGELQELVTALHLTDAYGPTFSIRECRSLHDIVRFVHEKAVLSMFEAGDSLLEKAHGMVCNLVSEVPFVLHLIDLGGGLAGEIPKNRKVSPEHVRSRPFRALWRGIATPGLHWGPPAGGGPVGEVFSSYLTDHKSDRPVGLPNYGLISGDYCNINARMDFHFTMVDALAGIHPRNNHIRFRFKGGGTDKTRRQRRARCIGEIFERFGFNVDVRDDLVNAALAGAPAEIIEERLEMVGRMLGFTRLLDAAMTDEETVAKVVEAFMAGDYALQTVSVPHTQA